MGRRIRGNIVDITSIPVLEGLEEGVAVVGVAVAVVGVAVVGVAMVGVAVVGVAMVGGAVAVVSSAVNRRQLATCNEV